MVDVSIKKLESVTHSNGVPAITWRIRDAQGRKNTKYEYMAFYVVNTQRWYVAGDARYYGSAELTTAQLHEFLNRDEVTGVFANDQQLWQDITH